MQERKQAVILFQSNEKFRNVQYSAGKAYLIQDIPSGYINKWVSYGHMILEDHKDKEVLEDVRPKDLIKSEYDAMVKREEKKAKGLEIEKGIKKAVAPEKIEEKVEEPIEEEVESIVEEEKVVEEEVVEEEPKKPSRGRRKKQ